MPMEADAFHLYHFHLYPCINKCFWCGKKCGCCSKNGFAPTLMKREEVGWLCKECLVRDCPPHKFFVHKLLRLFLNDLADMTQLITKFAYPVSFEPFTRYCFKCNPRVQTGRRCKVCSVLKPLAIPPDVYPSIEIDPALIMGPFHPYRAPMGVGMDNRENHRGWTNDGGWDWQLGRWDAGGSWARFGGGGSTYGAGGWSSGGGRWIDGWDWREERGWIRRSASVLDTS